MLRADSRTLSSTHNFPDSQNQIPTGFRLKALSWREERAPTLGSSRKEFNNPEGVAPLPEAGPKKWPGYPRADDGAVHLRSHLIATALRL